MLLLEGFDQIWDDHSFCPVLYFSVLVPGCKRKVFFYIFGIQAWDRDIIVFLQIAWLINEHYCREFIQIVKVFCADVPYMVFIPF